MEFQILGPPRVVVAEGSLDLGTPAERRLLAILLASPNRHVSDDRLLDELWADEPPPTARHLLRVYTSRLRSALSQAEAGAERVTREANGYRFRAAPDEIDAELFVAGAAEARELSAGNPDAAHAALSHGLGLWRGAPFAGLLDPPPSVTEQAERLERLRREAIGLWAQLGLQLGRHHELIPELTTLAGQDPYDEELHAQLMLALYRSGRQAEALQLARDLRSRLSDELGVEPSPMIRDLYRDILLQAPRLSLAPPDPPTNLPRPASSFVGRARELADLVELLGGSRLVTLTGPGGIGKTRLAIEAAAGERAGFPGGVWFVDMAAVTDPRSVVEELARTIGLTRAPAADLVVTLTRALSRQKALLVLDNCEHVAAPVAGLVTAILRDTIAPHILATSRTALHVEGERRFAVPPLGLPTSGTAEAMAESDAVRLFEERARAGDRSYAITSGNAPAVAEVCRRLDGLPLAIEMAAARLPVLPPADLIQHLEHGLALLGMPNIDSPQRHRTLEAAIDVSYALLSERERAVFERLSIFIGPFDLDAAAAVGLSDEPRTAVVQALSALIEASMLASEERDGHARYRMLETLKTYGRGCLQRHRTERSTRAAYVDYHIGLAAEAGAVGGTPAFAPWMPRLQDIYEELRQALEWSLAGDTPANALRAAPALWEFWFRRGDAREAGRWSALMLAGDLTGAPPEHLAAAHQAASFAADLGNDPAAGYSHSDAAVSLARQSGSASMLVSALWGRANVAFAAGDIGRMRDDALASLEAAGELPDPSARAGALAALGYASMVTGAPADAARLFDEAIPLYRALGDGAGLVIMGLAPRSEIALQQEDADAAEWLAGQALIASRGTGWEAAALTNYGDKLAELGDISGADAFASAGLRMALETGLELWFRRAARDMARNAARHGQYEQAAILLGVASRGLPAHSVDERVYKPTEARCRSELGGTTFERFASEGWSLTHEQVIDRFTEAGRCPSVATDVG
jgi:predicted ATPase/DNA-binding winged helix-turn-helix (wHTH) protein